MPLPVKDMQRALGGIIRKEVKAAAGDDGKLQAAERSALSPFVKDVAVKVGANAPVNDVVDAAMAKAMRAWAKQNQVTGRGAPVLSQKELAAVKRENRDLGVLTGRAAEIVLKKSAPTDEPVVALKNAPAGVTLSKSGDVYSITVENTVPRAPLTITVDGKDMTFTLYPRALGSNEAVAPEGFGMEDVAGGFSITPTSFTDKIRITRDAPGSLTTAEAAVKAKQGLIDYLKKDRIHDDDWSDYFPTTWAGVEADGTVGKIGELVNKRDGETLGRKSDRYLWVGPGPYGLYTEVEIAKKDGKVLRAYVEID